MFSMLNVLTNSTKLICVLLSKKLINVSLQALCYILVLHVTIWLIPKHINYLDYVSILIVCFRTYGRVSFHILSPTLCNYMESDGDWRPPNKELKRLDINILQINIRLSKPTPSWSTNNCRGLILSWWFDYGKLWRAIDELDKLNFDSNSLYQWTTNLGLIYQLL